MSYQTLLYPDGSISTGERGNDRIPHYKVEDFRNRTVVDLGCAEGMDDIWLRAKCGATRTIGIDNALHSTSKAEEMANAWGVSGCMFLNRSVQAVSPDMVQRDCPIVLLVNSVSRWVGFYEIMVWIKHLKPETIYLESHSEQDEWTDEVMRLAGLEGYAFDLIKMLPYTIKDPRPIRRFMRARRSEDIFKTFPPSRRLHLGVSFCLLNAAREAGLLVPNAIDRDDQYLQIQRIKGAITMGDLGRNSHIYASSTFAQVSLGVAFDWLVGNVDVRDQNGNWVMDEFNNPIRGDRHKENLLVDGSGFLYWIDYGHCFAHLTWIKDPRKHEVGPFSGAMPEDLTPGPLRNAIKNCSGEQICKEAEVFKKIRLRKNRWLTDEQVERMQAIVDERLGYLRPEILMTKIEGIGT
jgi:hypothetical protein